MGKKKKALAVVILVPLVFYLSLFGLYIMQEVNSRVALRDVEISIDGVDVKGLTLSGATLGIRLRMYNPNPFPATLDSADYSLYGNGNYLGNGIIPSRMDIPANGARSVSTDFDLSYGGAAGVLWSALLEGRVSWRLTGIAHIRTAIGAIDVPFDLSDLG